MTLGRGAGEVNRLQFCATLIGPEGEVSEVLTWVKADSAQRSGNVSESILEKVHAKLTTLAIGQPTAPNPQRFGLSGASDTSEVLMDEICLKASVRTRREETASAPTAHALGLAGRRPL